MKILHVVTRSDWAGAQKVLYHIVKGLSEMYPEDFSFEVACGPEDGRLIENLRRIGVKVHIIDDLVREIDPIKDMRAYLKLKSLIKNGNYDVVHTHSSKAGFLGRIAAKRSKAKKVIHTVHGLWPIEQFKGLKRKLVIILERVAARYSDKIVFLCKRDLEKALNWRICDLEKAVVIPNAVPPLNRFKRGKLRLLLKLDENVKVVGNVARISPPKNPIRFLEVAQKVLKFSKNVVFVWIGGKPEDSAYSKEILDFFEKSPDLKDKIFFLPFRDDAVELMADFDVFLLTSDEEGMPLAVLEALSLGIPVVSTSVGCLKEMERVDVGRDEKELVKKILKNLQNRVKKPLNSDFENFIRSYSKLYRSS